MFAWLVKAWPQVLLVLVAFTITFGTGWYVTGVRLDAEKAARLEDKATYRAAQSEYEAKALKEKIEKEAEYDRISKKHDAAYGDLLTQYRAALVRYKATQGTNGGYNLPSASEAPSGADGTSGDTILPVSEADLLICATNTAKAKIAHDWATEIQK